MSEKKHWCGKCDKCDCAFSSKTAKSRTNDKERKQEERRGNDNG